MELTKLTSILNEHGLKVRFTTKGLYRTIADLLPDDVTIVAAFEALTDKGLKAPVVVGETHVYVVSYKGMFPNVQTIRRSDITGVQIQSGALLAAISIQTPSGQYVIDRIADQDAAKLSSVLNQNP